MEDSSFSFSSDSEEEVSSGYEEEDSTYFPNSRERRQYYIRSQRGRFASAIPSQSDDGDDGDDDEEQPGTRLPAPGRAIPSPPPVPTIVQGGNSPARRPAPAVVEPGQNLNIERAPAVMDPGPNPLPAPIRLGENLPPPASRFDEVAALILLLGQDLAEQRRQYQGSDLQAHPEPPAPPIHAVPAVIAAQAPLRPGPSIAAPVPAAPPHRRPAPVPRAPAILERMSRPTFASRQHVSNITVNARAAPNARRVAPAQSRPHRLHQSSAPARASERPPAAPRPAQRARPSAPAIPPPPVAPILQAAPPRPVTPPPPPPPPPPAAPASPLTINAACIICFDHISNTVLLPCRHLVICQECANTGWEDGGKGEKCPVCRCNVESKVVVYRG